MKNVGSPLHSEETDGRRANLRWPMLLCAGLALLTTGCGYSQWRQSQRMPRIDPYPEQEDLAAYSSTQGRLAPPGVLDAIDGLDQPFRRPEVNLPPEPDEAKNRAENSVQPVAAEEEGPITSDAYSTVAVGPRQPLTLEEVRLAAFLGNLELNVVNFNPEIARQQVLQEVWKFESTFQGMARRNELDAPAPLIYDPVLPPIPSIFGSPPPQNTNFFGPGINVPLTTGGTLNFSEDITRRNVVVDAPIPNAYDLAPTLNFSQPLLRNAGVYVNTAQIQFSELQLGRVDAQTKLTAIRVLAEVEQAYWSLYGTQKNLEIALQQVDLAEEQVQYSRRLEKAGVVSNVDVLRSLSGLQLRQQFAVSARLQVKLANRQLKQVMQAPDLQVDTPAEVIAASAPNLVGLDFDRDALTAKAIDNRLELVDLALQYQQNQLAANVAENQILPKIDFVFQGRLLGLGTTAGSSSNQAWHGDSSEFFAGLSFSQGLAMNQTARANYRQACLTLARTTAQQQQVRINIVRQVNDAVDRFEQNWDRILVAQEAVTAARATFDAETRLFELGQRTSDLVLIAASNLATAQQQLVQAVVDYQISRVEIALATGTILGYAQMPPLQAVPVPPEPVGPQPAFGPARAFVR